MSITFSIENGREYVDANCPELIEVEPAEDGYPEFREYPYEANFANGNAYSLFAILAVEADYCGSIEPQALIGALQSTPAEWGSRAGSDTRGEGGARLIDCGTSTEMVARRMRALLEIAVEARRRGELVTWG